MPTLREEMMSKMGKVGKVGSPSLRGAIMGAMKGNGGFTVQGSADERTCPDCKGKIGKSFSGGSPRPPFHPNCRCSAH